MCRVSVNSRWWTAYHVINRQARLFGLIHGRNRLDRLDTPIQRNGVSVVVFVRRKNKTAYEDYRKVELPTFQASARTQELGRVPNLPTGHCAAWYLEKVSIRLTDCYHSVSVPKHPPPAQD